MTTANLFTSLPCHAGHLIRNQVRNGDVLIAGLGEDNNRVGRACCYPDDLPTAINKADCFRLRCLERLLLNRFCMYALNSVAVREQVRRYEQGVTRRRINTSNMRRVWVGCPSLTEQVTSIEILRANEALLHAALCSKEKLTKEKSGLMSRLLGGCT